MKTPLGIISGRFQGLHYQHIEYIQEALKRTEHLIIGITNHNPEIETTTNKEDARRNNQSNNPFTYYERYIMIKNTMIEMGYPLEVLDIVPFPIEEPQFISNYIDILGVHYLTIYDDWGRKKKEILEKLGYKVEIIKDCTIEEKCISSTQVRELILKEKDWEHLVPKAVYEYIKSHKLDERIRNKN